MFAIRRPIESKANITARAGSLIGNRRLEVTERIGVARRKTKSLPRSQLRKVLVRARYGSPGERVDRPLVTGHDVTLRDHANQATVGAEDRGAALCVSGGLGIASIRSTRITHMGAYRGARSCLWTLRLDP